MEQDYRTIHMDLGASGSYFGNGKLIGPIRKIMDTDGKVHSGVIHSLTVIASGSFGNELSFVFSESSSLASLTSSLPASGAYEILYAPTFRDLQNILGVVSTSGSIDSNSTLLNSGYSISTFRNIGIPFNCDTLYMASVFDAETTSSFKSGSLWATVGYELGQSR